MKTVTNGFKEQIAKLGREIDFKIFLHTNDKILTEDGKFLMTEDNIHLVVEQFEEEEVDEIITSEDIYNISIVNKGNLLSTMMKEFDFETTYDLRVGDVIDCSFGLKVNGEYEYINYGRYMIYSKEFNEDTKTYNYVAFDKMLLTMQEANQDFLTSLESKTLAECINLICDKVGLSYNATQEEIAEYPNLNKQINEGTFTDLQITYRDVLDMIAQALGLSMIVEGRYLRLKSLKSEVVDTFDEKYLKDTNVSFGNNYMINSVVLSRSEDNDNIYRRDEESVSEYGVHEFKIKDNLIMLYDDREDYIDEIFEQLNGLEYYINDFNSTGITYLDWLDFYNVTVGDKVYKCLMLNDEIKIQQGLEETVYTEEPEETVTDYKTSSKTDKEVSLIIDKQNGRIKAKVSQDDIIASLNVAIEDGQGVVELKGNSVIIDSDNLKADKYGNVECNNLKATNGQFVGEIKAGSKITLTDTGSQSNSMFKIKHNDRKNVQTSQYMGISTQEFITKNNIYEIEGWFSGTGSETTPSGAMLSVRNYDLGQTGETFYESNESGLQVSLGKTNNNYAFMKFDIRGTDTFYTSNDFSYLANLNNDFIRLQNGVWVSSTPQIYSDKRLKQEIKDIDTSWIDELKVKEFEYKKSPGKKQIGLIAQDYEDKEYAKYFLSQSEDGYYGIAYGNITNALIQYCQEMKKEINSLKEEIKQLKESDK